MTTPSPGSRLGPYEIVAPLAAGGMGEVFRALDTRLGREVAIKVLTADLAGDRERLRRFELEARAASALNHPNLLTVHDVGTVDGHPYLVCELLEGMTLAQRLVEGPLGVRQALDYAAQIARGLAAAHDKGILHRDLKPANIFVTRDDRVKILDFGLAKFQTPLAGAAIDQTPATMPGMVLGTAQYMSPEQVRGEALDHRSDIFSLGSMLFEMLAGRRAFGGEAAPSLVEALHAILRDDPFEGPALHLPPTLENLLRHCLDKNPELRFQSTRDLAYTLEALAGSGGVTAPGTTPASTGLGGLGGLGWRGWRAGRSGRRTLGGGAATTAAAAIAGVALGTGLGWLLFRALAVEPEPPLVRTLTYSGSERRPASSPDGRTIAFVSARDGRPRVWLKELARGTEAPLTDGPDLDPRFSADGAMLLFARHDGRLPALYRMSVVGGQARRVLDDAEQADFSPDGSQFAFLRTAEGNAGSVSVLGTAAADGSGARELRRFDDVFWANPRWSRDGRWIAVSRGGSGVRGAVVLVAADGSGVQPFELGSEGRVVGLAWTADGQLLIAQSETLSAGVRSAPGALRLCRPGGRCRSLLSVPNLGQGLDISSSGTAVYTSESTGQSLREQGVPGARAGAAAAQTPEAAAESSWLTHGSSSDRQPVYSPDGRWLTFSSDRSGNLDLWSLERSTGALRRLTDHPGEDWDPAYIPGGRSLLWSSNRSGSFEIWMADADGGEPRQVTRDGGDSQNPTATADGQWIVYVAFAQDKRGLWRVRPDGSDARRLVANDLRHPEVSPDGTLVAYHYLEPALGELIRVVRVEDGAAVPFSIQLAPGPGVGRCRWLPDGHGLAFVALDERGFLGVFRQDFTPGRDSAESRRPLGGFDADAATESFALSPGGDRLAISVERIQSFLQMASRLPGVEPAR